MNSASVVITIESMTNTSISLLLRLREPGDSEAWSRFVRLYGPLMYKWALSTGLQPNDASDIVQDVMALLVRKLPSFRYDESSSFRAWLKTVTLNKLREKFRRRSLPMSDATGSVLARVSNSDDVDFWEQEYRRDVVNQAIGLMQKHFQPAIWEPLQKYIRGEGKADDLAKEYDVSVWSLYAAKSRLLKHLRVELKGLLD